MCVAVLGTENAPRRATRSVPESTEYYLGVFLRPAFLEYSPLVRCPSHDHRSHVAGPADFIDACLN